MSYILDALKKSDRERQQEAPLHLQPLYETSPSLKTGGGLRRRRWPFFLLVGLLCSGALLKWSGWNPWTGNSGEKAEVNPPPQSAQSPPSPQESAETGQAPDVAEGEKNIHPLKVQAEWFDDWVQRLPKNDYPPPDQSVSPDEEEPEGIPSVVKLTAAQSKKSTALVRIKKDREKVFMAPQDGSTVMTQPPPAAIVRSEPIPPVIGQRDPAPTVSRSAEPASAIMAEPQPSPPAVRQPQPVASAVGRAQPAPSEKNRNLPYLHDLPQQVQADIPKLQFAGHAYAVDPAQRLIVVNGTIMREGDPIDAATRLAEITWEGVVIDRKGVRFQMKCY